MNSYRPFRDIIARHADTFPERTYLHGIDQDLSLTYGDLFALTRRMARYLDDTGIGINDRILLLAENCLEAVVVYLGVLTHGATLAFVSPAQNHRHLRDIVGALNPRLALIADGAGAALDEEMETGHRIPLGHFSQTRPTGFFTELADLSDDDARGGPPQATDAAVIVYTSGTDAKPKGVVRSHESLFYTFDATAQSLDLSASDRILDVRPVSWMSAQQTAIGAPLFQGATSYLAEHFSAAYFEWLRRFQVTIGIASPAIIASLIARKASVNAGDLPHLRFLASSSAPLSTAHWQRFEALYNVPIAQGYGSTESGRICGSHGGNCRIGSVGKAAKHQSVRILDPNGRSLPPGYIGEIVVSGKPQATGYLLPDGTVTTLPVDGIHTGDLGQFDGDGYLFITGRLKEMIIRRGVKIAPAEIEQVLNEHPDIAESAVVGVPDARYGEELIAFVVALAEVDFDAGKALSYCRANLPRIKVPKDVILTDALPRNARNKLDRAALVARWQERRRQRD